MVAVDSSTKELAVAAPLEKVVALQVTMTVKPLSAASVKVQRGARLTAAVEALVSAPLDAGLRRRKRARLFETHRHRLLLSDADADRDHRQRAQHDDEEQGGNEREAAGRCAHHGAFTTCTSLSNCTDSPLCEICSDKVASALRCAVPDE